MSTFQATLPAQAAAAADATTVVGEVAVTDVVHYLQASIVAPSGYTTLTGVATNNVTFNVRLVRAGSVVATFASLTLNVGVNLAAESTVQIPLTAVVAPVQGDVVDVVMHQNGAGLAVAAGLVAEVTLS